MQLRTLAPSSCSLILAALFAGPAGAMPAVGDGPDGVCTMEEEAVGACFQYPGGFVVEIIPGGGGEFPILTSEGNSEFSYLITGLGGGGGCHDVSHADITIPVCADPLVIVSAGPEAEVLTNGHGDPSCGFGSKDLEHDVLKWDIGVPCGGSLVVTVVFEGIVQAELQQFLLKAANDCYVATILGPSCEVTPPSTGEPYCFGNGCPCANEDPSAGCANSSGSGGLLTGSGSTSILANDLTMTATNLVPNQSALLFAGDLALNGGNGRAFGDGLRCAGVNLVRLQIGLPDANGSLVFGPGVIGLDANPTAGQTRYMQVWYRDPVGSPCDSGFNLTNAIGITYTP